MVAQAQQGRDVERLEGRIGGDAITLPQDPLEAGRFTVDENQFDLGMRDAERLYHVLDRRGACTRSFEFPLAQCRRGEDVQLLIEGEGGGDHWASSEPAAGGGAGALAHARR